MKNRAATRPEDRADAREERHRRLNIMAEHYRRYLEAQQQKGNDDQRRIAWAGVEGAVTEYLTAEKPRDLDGIVSMLAIARGYAALDDIFDDGDGFRLITAASEAHLRLTMLKNVLHEVIYALCLKGAQVHEAATPWTTDANLADWGRASSTIGAHARR